VITVTTRSENVITVTTSCDVCAKIIDRGQNDTKPSLTLLVCGEPLFTLHFCGWPCLAKYAADKQEPPAEPVEEKELAFPDWTIDGD